VSEIVRAKALNWLMEIFIVYRLEKHAYFRAAMLFDCYAQRAEAPLSDRDVELYALTALFLAVKYEAEESRLTMAHLVTFGRDKFSAETFAAAEDRLFARLAYRVGFPTHLDVLDELMLRGNFVFDSSYRLQQVAESVLIRCLLYPHMLRTRPDVLCAAALVYTIRLFYEHYRAVLRAERRAFNRFDLEAKESFLTDRIAQIAKLNKAMLLSVCAELQELVEDFDDYKEKGGLYSIASLEDLDSL